APSPGKDTSTKDAEIKAPPEPTREEKRAQFQRDEEQRISKSHLLGPVKPGQSYVDVVKEVAKTYKSDWSDAKVKQIADLLKTLNKKDAPAAGDMLQTTTAQAMQKELATQMQTYDNDLKEFDRPAKQVEDRFETKDILKAFEAAKEQNLPVIVQAGAWWCPHCQKMSATVLPEFEGSESAEGSMQKKAIFLHLDVPASRFLSGDAAAKAKELMKGIDGFPTYKVYQPGDYSKPVATEAGEMPRDEFVKFLKKAGISVPEK
ncbi:MAG: thioredoxin family protein, partial [Candidatus Obscuribacterales bacterium]|nr:thioredoxin family protein [Candidatus Obscuribacterales bacterium]